MIKLFIDYFTKERNLVGWISFAIDLLFLVGVLTTCFIFLFKHVKKSFLIPVIVAYILLFTVAYLLDLLLMKSILYIALFVMTIVVLLYYAPRVKNVLNHNMKVKDSKQFLSNEETKEELINALLKTVNHLSARRIGAIITIEKEHMLNVYIDKAIKLESLITFELLTTIFHPNTALHDGAVIIRGNHIMCANAFFPSSDKNDIPQQYGSRHRAAIGISEVSDAFTIVVSEETGQIATTIAGTITGNVSLDGLKLSLGQHIIVQ